MSIADRRPAPRATAANLAPKVDAALVHYPDTDAGNAERFVHYTRGTVRYAPGMGWLLWTGTHRESDPSELVLRLALDAIRATHATSALLDNAERRASLGKHARASEALGRLRAMVDLARVSPEVHILPDRIDADPWTLNTLSGLVDLRTATQRPHDPTALCTRLAPAVFDLDAEHPALDALLDALDRDGRAEYIRGTLGQALTGRSSKTVSVWTGPSGTVKSTTADAAMAALGPYAVSIEPSTLIVSKYGASAGGARADLVALRGARLAIAPEMPNGGRLDSELVKRLSGRDPITARSPFAKEALTFTPGHTLVMHSNHEPRVDWNDDGMRARISVVPSGDPITFVREVVEFGHDARLVAGKAIDDGLGCAVLWSVLEAGAPPAGRFVAAFTSQEEVGLKGAGIAGERIRPHLALALDTMPSGDTPDIHAGKDLGVAIGAGPVLQVLAGQGGRGFLVNQSVKRYLRRIAAAAGVSLQLTTFTGGNNDAATIAWSGLGVPAASVCLACRYSHSPLEVADLGDAEAAFRLLRAVVEGMDELPAFGFLG